MQNKEGKFSLFALFQAGGLFGEEHPVAEAAKPGRGAGKTPLQDDPFNCGREPLVAAAVWKGQMPAYLPAAEG